MASDPGDLSWLDDVRSGAWLEGADWLFVSGYALLRTPDPQRVVETAAVARAHGTRIAVDLVVRGDGRATSAPTPSRDLCRSLRPVGGVRDRRRVGHQPGRRSAPAATRCWCSSTAAAGASFVIDEDESDERAPVAGSGRRRDRGRRRAGGRLPASAAPDLAMAAAARCVAQRGAQPPGAGAVNGPLAFRGVEIPAERAGLAVQPVQRPRRPVGEHRRLAGGAELRRRRSDRAARAACATGCWHGSRTGWSAGC